MPTATPFDPGFPDPRTAEAHGLLAVGGDYEPDFLLAAYRRGIFPWPSDELPYAWFSPDPRLVLAPEELQVSRSLAKTLRKRPFELRFDTAFHEVVDRCAEATRPGQEGTWIVPELRHGFERLHQQGHAHSLEAWQGGRLVGGLYGLAMGSIFCGESMFFEEPNASKACLVALVATLREWDFDLIDCQVHTEHLERFGAVEWPRSVFLDAIEEGLTRTGRPGTWRDETVQFTALDAVALPGARLTRRLERYRRLPGRVLDAGLAAPDAPLVPARPEQPPTPPSIQESEAFLNWLMRMTEKLATAPRITPSGSRSDLEADQRTG